MKKMITILCYSILTLNAQAQKGETSPETLFPEDLFRYDQVISDYQKPDRYYECENNLLEVMFDENAKVRLRDGTLVDFSTNATAGLANILNELQWFEWYSFSDVSEDFLDKLSEDGSRNTGQPVYNLNNIYRLVIPEQKNIWELSHTLESLPGIIYAKPVPKPMELPLPPNYQGMQGYITPAVNVPGGIDAQYAWTRSGGTGTGITICDLEYEWNYNHADVTKAVGSQINTNLGTTSWGDNHGTAVIGQLVSNNNGWGTTGASYGSGLKTCGTYYGTPPSWNVAGAITLSISHLSAGDIILLEQQWDYTGSDGFVPIEWWGNSSPNAQTNNPVYAAIVNAVSNNIHVVQAGGNGNVNTGNLTWYGNSGAVIVGAGGGTAGNDLAKLDFSSYGPRFDVQAWGQNVTTTGYGSLYSAEGKNYFYTSTFGGTSSASPIVTSAIACFSGYWKANISATPPSPSYMRTILKRHGRPQVNPATGLIGPRPDLRAMINGHIYCAASGGCDEYISRVQFGTIDNTSACNNYIDYTSIHSADLPLNVTQLLTITNGNPYPVDQCGVWIDWNRDGDFNDANETITVTGTPGPGPYTASITPPAGTTTGPVRMRIRITYTGAVSPCGTTTYGEVEDYTINLTAKVPNVWTGAFNRFWGNSQNWSLGYIPGADDDVIITSAGFQPVTIDYSDKACKNLTIESGEMLIKGYAMQVNGNLNIHGKLSMDNAAGELNVTGNVLWQSGSTAAITAASKMNVYGSWNFNAGSNANLTNGFVDFRGATDNWIRSYSNNSSFFNMRIYKTGGSKSRVSWVSTTDLVINNLTFINSGAIFESHSDYNIVMKGDFNYYGTFDFTMSGNTGSAVFSGSSQNINNYSSGSGVFNNVRINSTTGTTIVNGDITIANNLTINSGQLNVGANTITIGGNWTNNNFPGGFNRGTGRVIFNGASHQYVNSSENFNILEVDKGAALRVANSSATVTCNQYDWKAGGIDVIAGTFTALDLVQNGIFGGYWLNPGGVINLTNDDGWVDLNANLNIFGGNFNVYGGTTSSYWPWSANATINMSGGVLDFKDQGIIIHHTNTYSLTENITGGTIRTSRGFQGNRADFTPSAGVFEFYGGSNWNISQSNESTLRNVVINKTAKDGGEDHINGPVYDERSGELLSDGSKANTITLSSNFAVTGNLTVQAGSFNLGAHTCNVSGTTTVYGNLIMNNVANDLTTHNMIWDNGSTANVSAGTFHTTYWFFKEGTTAKIGIGNTAYVKSIYFPTSGDAEHGNLVLEPFSKIISDGSDAKAYYPVWVMGDLLIKSGANQSFWVSGSPLLVAGNAVIESGASIVFSAADFEVGGTLNLAGTLQVSSGRTATIQGEFTFPSSGWLSLNNATFTNNYNAASGLTTLSGKLTMNAGSVAEFPGRSINLGVPFVNEISGGTLRFGRTFNSTTAGTFQQNSGTIEFISTNSGHYIMLTNGNYANNIIIDKPSGILSLTADLTLKGNLNIEAGAFSSNSYTIQIAGDWTNNVGTAGFTEGTSTVIFNGPNRAKINTAETFYSMIVNKTYDGFDGLEIMSVPVTVLNNLDIIDGTLEVNSNSVLTIGNNVSIADGAGLNVGILDFDIEVYIGGNYTNNNTSYNTIHGYTPGGETITFNGSGDQFIYTVAPQEDFGNFRVDKPSGSLRPNGNLQVLGDFEVVSGSFFRHITGLTHSFHGDFTLGANGSYNPGTPSTTVFKGMNDQDYFRSPGGLGTFNSIVVDKTAAKLFIPPTVERGEKPIASQNDGKSKGMTVNLLSGLVVFNGGTTTIENGTLNLNGNSFKSVGNYNINSGGVLNASPGSSISIVDGLFVNDGGVLELFGTAANNVVVHKDVAGLYQFEVNSGGTIRASHTNFRDMNANGINIKPGAIVDATHSFHHCTFRLGAPAPSTLLTIDNNQTFTVNHAIFPANTWGGLYNVTKSVNQGLVTFYNATGGFAGENFDNDVFNRVDWFEPTLTASPSARTVAPPAGSTTFNITSNMTWTVAESTGWFSVSPMWGSNNGTITVSYDRNTSSSSRSGTITLSATDCADVTLTVTQEGVSLSVNPLVRDVTAAAGTVGFSLNSNAAWTISESVPWFSVAPLNGTGNSLITVNYDENTSLTPRSGQFTVSSTGAPDVIATVNQAGVVIPENFTVPSIIVAPGVYECFNASNTITVQYFIVKNGGAVNLVAGQSINFLPGFHAENGSYLHAWISSVDHCGIIPPPVLTASLIDETIISVMEEIPAFETDQFFKAYPNPTTGLFTLEMNDDGEYEKVRFEIYNMLGENLLHTELPAMSHYQFDLSGVQKGIYLIRVTQGDKTGFEKVIRQ